MGYVGIVSQNQQVCGWRLPTDELAAPEERELACLSTCQWHGPDRCAAEKKDVVTSQVLLISYLWDFNMLKNTINWIVYLNSYPW